MGGSSSKGRAKEARQKKCNKPQQADITFSDRVKLQLKIQRDSLVTAMRRFEIVGDIEHNKARQFLTAGDKRKALYCLKRKRAQYEQLNSVSAMLDNIETLIETVDFVQMESEVVMALKSGKEELDRLNRNLNIDDVEKLMSETRESIEQARLIDSVINERLSSVEDDTVLLKELEMEMRTGPESDVLNCLDVPQHELQQKAQTQQESEKLTSEKLPEAV